MIDLTVYRRLTADEQTRVRTGYRGIRRLILAIAAK